MTDPADAHVGSESAVQTVPAAPPGARALFGGELASAEQYVRLLATIGIAHGHIGPRELPRLWDRHLVNCAVVTELVPTGATVVDVGSGAGLPGLPMAIRRPDLEVILVEPMLRRSAFLDQVVDDLELGARVRVLRGRAEEPPVRIAVGNAEWATARAVAPLERLLGWCLPLLGPGGQLLALKGSSATDEVARFRASAPHALRDAVEYLEVVELGREYATEPTQVIRVARSARRRRSQ